MDDRFLEKFRKNPRPEFARQLYGRLNRQEAPRRTLRRSSKFLIQGILAFSLVAVLTLMMVMPGVLARSPGIGVHYLPGPNIIQETDRLGSTIAVSVTTPRAKVVTVENLQEARRLAGFPFKVPTWIPANLVLERSVKMAGTQDYKDFDRTALFGKEIFIQPYGVGLTYRDTRSTRKIQLWVVRSDYWSDPIPPSEIGRGSYENLKVNGLPGGLVQGQWDTRSGRWNYYRGGFLVWAAEGLRYYLVTTGGPLVEADLIKMAGSLK